MDVVTVVNINICINEVGCLKMKKVVYYNGIWYTLNNQDTFLTNTLMIMVIKKGGDYVPFINYF